MYIWNIGWYYCIVVDNTVSIRYQLSYQSNSCSTSYENISVGDVIILLLQSYWPFLTIKPACAQYNLTPYVAVLNWTNLNNLKVKLFHAKNNIRQCIQKSDCVFSIFLHLYQCRCGHPYLLHQVAFTCIAQMEWSQIHSKICRHQAPAQSHDL